MSNPDVDNGRHRPLFWRTENSLKQKKSYPKISYPKDRGFGISTSIPYNAQEMSEMYFMKPARTDSFTENES